MVKQVLLIILTSGLLIFTAACTIQPIWKLTYLQAYEKQRLPLTNGCYYIGERQSDNTEILIGYWVFFENGLAKNGGVMCGEEDSIESIILADLKTDFYKLPYVWETFVTLNDTLISQHLLSTYVIIGDIGYKKGVFENDTIFRIYEAQNKELIFKMNKTYTYLPFSTQPDSTGYLYDKLQKKKAKELKKKRKEKSG